MALLAARLSRFGKRLPHADISLRDADLVAELDQLRTELRNEDRDLLDPAIRSVLLHNLSVVSMLMGDISACVEYARRALLDEPSNHDYWVRYGFSLAVSGLPGDPELLQNAPTDDAQIQLLLADIEHRSGEIDAAYTRTERALELPNLEPGLAARLESQLIVASGPPELDDGRVQKLLERATTSPFPGPFIVRLLGDPQFSANFSEQLGQIVEQADFSQTSPGERVALAGMLVACGFITNAAPFLPDLRNLLRLCDGIFDPSIAGVLMRILAATRRLQEAGAVSLEWCRSDPDNAYARWMRTQVLLRGGRLRSS